MVVVGEMPFSLVFLDGSSSRHLGPAKQMTEKHHPAIATTQHLLSGLAAFLPHFPGSQPHVLELLPGVHGAAEPIAAQTSPGKMGLVMAFSHQTDAQDHKQAHCFW